MIKTRTGPFSALRLLTILAVLVLLAGACGDDSIDDALDRVDGSESEPADTDPDTSDPAGPGDDATDSDGSEPSGSIECAEVRAAIEQASDLSAIAPGASGGSPEETRASFEQSIAALRVIGEEVPELRGDVDDALAGFELMADALESIDWDVANIQTSPAAALEFAQRFTDPAVLGMSGAVANIAAWLQTECTIS